MNVAELFKGLGLGAKYPKIACFGFGLGNYTRILRIRPFGLSFLGGLQSAHSTTAHGGSLVSASPTCWPVQPHEN